MSLCRYCTSDKYLCIFATIRSSSQSRIMCVNRASREFCAFIQLVDNSLFISFTCLTLLDHSLPTHGALIHASYTTATRDSPHSFPTASPVLRFDMWGVGNVRFVHSPNCTLISTLPLHSVVQSTCPVTHPPNRTCTLCNVQGVRSRAERRPKKVYPNRIPSASAALRPLQPRSLDDLPLDEWSVWKDCIYEPGPSSLLHTHLIHSHPVCTYCTTIRLRICRWDEWVRGLLR